MQDLFSMPTEKLEALEAFAEQCDRLTQPSAQRKKLLQIINDVQSKGLELVLKGGTESIPPEQLPQTVRYAQRSVADRMQVPEILRDLLWPEMPLDAEIDIIHMLRIPSKLARAGIVLAED